MLSLPSCRTRWRRPRTLPVIRRRTELRPCASLPPGGCVAGTGLLVPTRRMCCRSSAPRSSSPGCPRCSGSGRAMSSGCRRSRTRPTRLALSLQVPLRWSSTALLRSALRRRRWSGSTRRRTRTGKCSVSTICARWSPGPATAARSSSPTSATSSSAGTTSRRCRSCIPTFVAHRMRDYSPSTRCRSGRIWLAIAPGSSPATVASSPSCSRCASTRG